MRCRSSASRVPGTGKGSRSTSSSRLIYRPGPAKKQPASSRCRRAAAAKAPAERAAAASLPGEKPPYGDDLPPANTWSDPKRRRRALARGIAFGERFDGILGFLGAFNLFPSKCLDVGYISLSVYLYLSSCVVICQKIYLVVHPMVSINMKSKAPSPACWAP